MEEKEKVEKEKRKQEMDEQDTPKKKFASIAEGLEYWLIEKVQSPGEFCAASGMNSVVMPGIKVNKVGVLSLPLREEQAKQLIAVCSNAPFGRREKTVYDPTVRNTWQLNPKSFTF